MTPTPFRRSASAALLVSAAALAGCATTSAKPPAIAYDDPPREIAATPAAEPPRAVEVVTIPEPLPLPGQLKPVTDSAPTSEPTDPRRRVGAANAAARVQPTRDGYANAIQQYPWTQGALYQVYTAPGQVTDIALQEGEQLVGPGSVAAGDTVRWIIGDTVSGSGATARVHILVKPTRSDIATNLVINTDRRDWDILAALLRGDDRAAEVAGKWRAEFRRLAVVARPRCDCLGGGAAVGAIEFLGLLLARRLERVDQRAADAEAGGDAYEGQRLARQPHDARRIAPKLEGLRVGARRSRCGCLGRGIAGGIGHGRPLRPSSRTMRTRCSLRRSPRRSSAAANSRSTTM
jgi:hypothetical protein